MKKFLLFVLLLAMSGMLSAQTVVLDVDRVAQQRRTKFGPNLDKFSHLSFLFGMIASADKPGARIIYGNSVNLGLAIRTKFKISSVYSLGYDLDFRYTDFKLRQKKDKIVPDTVINNYSQRLDYGDISAGFFNRINFDPDRGNYLGTFLDLGIRGSFGYSIRKISKNKETDGTRTKLIVTSLPFVNKFQGSFYGRFGKNHFAVYWDYRFTNLFKKSYNFPELPRLMLGIDMGLF